jgi:hypothetical protein
LQKHHRNSGNNSIIQLANREATSGDISRARQIVNERISNPCNDSIRLMNIDQQEIYRALAKGKVMKR